MEIVLNAPNPKEEDLKPIIRTGMNVSTYHF